MLIAKAALWLANRFAKDKFTITRGWNGERYMTRYALLGKRNAGTRHAVYLHQFHKSDADEMHDHPWMFVSIILSGGYWEKTPASGWQNGDGPSRLRWYGPGRILVRPAHWIHSVIIDPDGPPVVTLIIRGRKQKSWGFYCPRLGFRPWREHHAAAMQTGEGCAP